jgi:hypothetical protein
VFAPAANRNGYSMCGLRGTLVSRRSRPGTACRGANGATARAPSTNTRPGEHENARRSCVLTQPRCACNVASATPCSSVRSAAGRSTHPAAASTRGTCASTILPLCCNRNFIESARTTFPVPDDVWKQRAFRVTTNAPYLLASRRAALPVRCFGHARGGVVAFATGQHAA